MTLPRTLDGGLVQLRALTMRDATSVQRLAGNAQVSAMTATIPHPYPPGAACEWIATHAHGRRQGDFVYGVVRADGMLVGALGLRIAPNAHGNLGYWIGHPYWGNGYATAAARAGIDALFTHTSLGWLMAAHLADNDRSRSVLAKVSMREVARSPAMHRGRDVALVLRRIDRAAWAQQRASGDIGDQRA
ncbi:MAG: GNAT family N-acetyltransferase [Casimicrobiaceae bacterium]